MQGLNRNGRHALIWAWAIAVLIFLYIPGLCIFLASLTASRYFQFPITRWGLDWWRNTVDSIEVHRWCKTSISIA